MNIPCAPVIPCGNVPDSALFSLEDDPLPFFLFCPPPYDCSQADSITMNACGQTFSANLSGMTKAQREQTINALVQQYLAALSFCGNNIPTELFYNAPQQCSTLCPDGTTFTYTVQAGKFLAPTQAEANLLAKQDCITQLPLSVICLGGLPGCLCVGNFFTARLALTSTPKLVVWTISGSLPPGLTAHTNIPGQSLLIDGTPTQPGTYTFSVHAFDGNGNSNAKTFTMSVMTILTVELPAFTIGVPYSYQLQAGGGSGNYLWTILEGTLPPGLVLSNTGIISGTPT